MARTPHLSPQMLVFLIRQAGWTQKQIAEALQMSQGGVSHAIQTGSSEQVRTWVSVLLQRSPESLWPHRYPGTARPKRIHAERDGVRKGE